MIRHSVIKNIRPVLRSPSLIFTRMAGGDTGAPRSSGGKTSTDAFTKREKASEDLYVREQEKAKLLEVRKKLAESQKHVQEIEEHLKALEKESGGEHK